MFNSPSTLCLMYHRVFDPKSAHDPSLFVTHFAKIAKNYPVVIPGKSSSTTPLSICLTFDDAYFDFYRFVFPLLKYFNVRALLAVPVKYILASTQKTPSTRLSVPYPKGMDNNAYQEYVPFCTWKELQEMVHSGLVKIASHSYSHVHCGEKGFDFEKEVIQANTILQEKLKCQVEYFVYPYGDFSRTINQAILKHHPFTMRIGSSINKGWARESGLLYRIDAEPFWHEGKFWREKDLHKWHKKYWLNKLRFK
ncbi:MAG TPA: polysaccharide deacetylase family protein [Gammaproteobacteria bacterium]|nr:polysaccharide deacetylase family protein [Gammaproteobacteria bacterium]